MLAHKGFTVKEWLATYTDMPNKLSKLAVWSARTFTTVEGTAEQKIAWPEGIQKNIDYIVAKYKDGRCFVRPSGTEEVLRVYGEASEAYDVDDMVDKVSNMILRSQDPNKIPIRVD